MRHEAFATGAEEADWIAAEVARRVREGAAYRDIAILVRANAAADPILRSLNLEGVPWRFSGTSGLYTRPEVRLLLSFLRAIADVGSSVDVYALAASDLYRLGGEDLVNIVTNARRRNRTVFEVLDELQRQPGILRLSPETRAAATTLVEDLKRYVELAHERPAGEVLYAFLRGSGWLKRLAETDSVANEEALSNIARFFDIIRAQSALLADDRAVFVARHLQTLIQAGDDPPTADIDPEANAVAVMTVHKAKGLEFPVVYLPGLITGRFPAIGRREQLALPLELVNETLPEGDYQLQEERRLFYVGHDPGPRRARAVARGRLRRPAGAAGVAVRPRGARPAGRGRDAPARARRRRRRSSGWPGSSGPEPAPAPRRSRDDEPLWLSFYAIDDYLTCPLKYKYRPRAADAARAAPLDDLRVGAPRRRVGVPQAPRARRGHERGAAVRLVPGGLDERRVPVARARGGAARGRPPGAQPVPRGAAPAGRDHPGLGRARVQLLPRRRQGPRPVRPGGHHAARPGRARSR